MKDIYLERLLEQFKQATGARYVDVNSSAFISEFQDWVLRNQKIGSDYRGVIECMDLHPEIRSTTAEVGKGILDSIAIDSAMSIITPYSDKIKSIGELFDGNFVVNGDDPYLIPRDNSEVTLLNTMFERFITQNPYEQSCLENWENLHNSGNSNITIGVYGCTYDKDYQAKLAALKSFKERLYEGYREEQLTMGDSYFAVVSSDRMVKELILTKSYYNEEEQTYTRGRGR
ncbi:MAG: hypothetical protein J6B98_03980 [Bacilli bacterium]|nr:hypothetical protein [Bacilli bacterium]